MSAVDRTGAPEPQWENRPSRNQDFKLPLRLLARPRHPVSRSTWKPDSSRSAQHAHRRPVYVSFVSKAVLWDRGLPHYTTRENPIHLPFLCPRFLSHMKARPEDLSPPCFLGSKSIPQPPSLGKTRDTHVLAAPKTQTLEGCLHFRPERRNCGVQKRGLNAGRCSAVVIPCLLFPATPPPSTITPTPPHQNTLHPDSGRQQDAPYTVAASPCGSRPPLQKKKDFQEKVRAPQPAVVSVTESAELQWKLNHRPAGPQLSDSPALTHSHGSLSDLSRPPSSLFSRSTDLASGRSSALSDLIDSSPEGSIRSSPFHPSTVIEIPLASPPAGASPHQSARKPTTPPLCKPAFGQTKPLSPHSTSSIHPHSAKPASASKSTKSAQNLHQDSPTDPGFIPSLGSDQGPVTLTFPSTAWSSCPSPPRTTPPLESRTKLTDSPLVSRLESHRWPVLPPISPVRGCCGTAASHYSELSCSQSHVFDELEAIAPRSPSCVSVDEAPDSSACSSPDTELSPGLAALTVGCDSGNLGSLSRVQLLLLDRAEFEAPQSARSLEEDFSLMHDWGDLMMQYDPGLSSAGVSRPPTAGSISERCDSAGKVLENKSVTAQMKEATQRSPIILDGRRTLSLQLEEVDLRVLTTEMKRRTQRQRRGKQSILKWASVLKTMHSPKTAEGSRERRVLQAFSQKFYSFPQVPKFWHPSLCESAGAGECDNRNPHLRSRLRGRPFAEVSEADIRRQLPPCDSCLESTVLVQETVKAQRL
ncbi:hypothetical protein Q8A73_021816 [Channa argus]|nr:hypothetical protein Q8A73_021816 [Channa argus]